MTIKLMHGDCLIRMKEIPDKSVDMVLADPPYGTTACKWDSVIPFEPMWKELKRITKKNAAIVLTSSQPFTSALTLSNVDNYAHYWIWNKGVGVNFMHAKRQPLKTTEDVLVFSYGTPKYRPIMTPKDKPTKKSNNNVGESSGYEIDPDDVRYKGKVYTESYPNVIINISSRGAGSRGLHPTQKPVALMQYLIQTYTDKGDMVLDFTMGSGTTGVACVNTNRNFIGIELERKYYITARNRIRETL
jgi:site-specific DNA-methyltransferase (adenine-specific)